MKFKLLVLLCSFLSIFNINCMTLDDAEVAIDSNNMQKVLQFLNEVKDVNSRKTDSGATLLHYAALNGKKDIAEMLLLRGADVNIASATNWTPLHQAAFQSNPEIMELLLRNNANPNALTNEGDSPLHLLLVLNEPSINTVKLLLQYKADPRLLDADNKKPADYAEDQAIINLLNAAELELNKKEEEMQSESASTAFEPSADKSDKREA